MCTGLFIQFKNSYFGRSLDYEFSYGEQVCIMPRNFELKLKNKTTISSHYAIIGMAHIYNNYPLFYEAMNEKGLAIAGLNFVNNACYFDEANNYINIAQYEFIPYLLSTCKNIHEVKEKLNNLNITNIPFNDKFPLSSLHYIISDLDNCIVVEQTIDGLHVYDNPYGVLTNNPPFEKQIANLKQFDKLTNISSKNNKRDDYSRGDGGINLPGDLTSKSRFIRTYFYKKYSIDRNDENLNVSQFFHILGSVDQIHGGVKVDDNNYEISIYTSCMNLNLGIYYYKTYDNSQINAVKLFNEDLNNNNLICFELNNKQNIKNHN